MRHPVGQCPIAADKQGGSQRCEDAKSGLEISCGYGHPGCFLAEWRRLRPGTVECCTRIPMMGHPDDWRMPR
jgi:hypothetical protein